ncbi:MAG: recombinase family protein, partial [Candidatus Korobacteraceae bacterium]
SMLADPIYLGYYTWNKYHFGKFHRFANGQTVFELNYEEKGSKNKETDWVQSRRLFAQLVDQKTWSLDLKQAYPERIAA